MECISKTLNFRHSNIRIWRRKEPVCKDHDIIRVFETAHNEAQPELLFDFVNIHVNLTIDIRTVKGEAV